MAEHKDYERLQWQCATCGATQPPTGTGYGRLMRHDCSDEPKLELVDLDTGQVLATSLKQAVKLGFVEKQEEPTGKPKTPPIGAEGNEHILEHYKGYAKDKERIVFILDENGKITDLRMEEPLLYPIFQLMRKERGYKGDFPQFLADAVETLFANAGYELALVPKSQSIIYNEVMRLLNEGKLMLKYGEDGDLTKVDVSQEERSFSVEELCRIGNALRRRDNEGENGDTERPYPQRKKGTQLPPKRKQEKPGKSQ